MAKGKGVEMYKIVNLLLQVKPHQSGMSGKIVLEK
jgi:hypothetical protein